MLTGGCHCGAVRYEAAGVPDHATICHCTDCRRVSGAPALAWFTVARKDFRLARGTLRTYASSPEAERGFYGACGTALTFTGQEAPGEIDVTAASLDDPSAAPPADHVWTASRVPWDIPGDGLPQHPRSRGEEG